MNSRTNHNLGIASLDTRYQPLDADLTAIAALGFTDTSFLKKTAADTWALDTNTYSLSSHDHAGVYEPVLGNPAVDGYVLSSTVAGVRSWVAQGGGGGGYATIQEEGTDLTQRTIMNFIGAGITASDDAANTRTNITLDATLNSLSALGTAADKMLYTTGVDTWAEASLTAAGRSILDDATVGDIRTTLGVGTADSPTFAGLNLGTGNLSTVRNIVFDGAADALLSQNTADASDNRRIVIAGGGAFGTARGANIYLDGNEYSANTQGTLYLGSGVSGTTGTYDSMIVFSSNGANAAYFDRSQNLNILSHQLILNSTAYLDGASAGWVNIYPANGVNILDASSPELRLTETSDANTRILQLKVNNTASTVDIVSTFGATGAWPMRLMMVSTAAMTIGTSAQVNLGTATTATAAGQLGLNRLYLNSTAYIDGADAGNILLQPSLGGGLKVVGLGAADQVILRAGAGGAASYVNFGSHVIPAVTATYDLGYSTLYYRYGYIGRLYLNSAAYLDGATAGRIIANTQVQVNYGATNTPAFLATSSGAGWGSGIQFINSAAGGRTYGIYVGNENPSAWHFSDVTGSVDRLVISSAGATSIYGASGNALQITNPSAGVIAFTVV